MDQAQEAGRALARPRSGFGLGLGRGLGSALRLGLGGGLEFPDPTPPHSHPVGYTTPVCNAAEADQGDDQGDEVEPGSVAAEVDLTLTLHLV